MLACLLSNGPVGLGERSLLFMVPASEVQDGYGRVMTVCGRRDIITTAVLAGGRDRLDCNSVEMPRRIIYLDF